MPPQILTTESLTQVLRGRQVAHASFDGKQRLGIQFSDGSSLVAEASSKELVVVVERRSSQSTSLSLEGRQPSQTLNDISLFFQHRA